MKPVSYDARKLELLLGPQEITANETGIAKTLDWIAAQAR
jgi:hypothetical protein